MAAKIRRELFSLPTWPSEIERRKNAACDNCGACLSNAKTLARCGKCKVKYYCNQDCQKKGWRLHKLRCNKNVEEELRVKSTNDCCVCMEDMILSRVSACEEGYVTILPCEHYMHARCWQDFEKVKLAADEASACPVCRDMGRG